ncbi:hypothetical protein B0A48_03396 [Cryoendolithus antarcticus]|uniref:Uncharacterized protein n=1 Tax=Cryoendolithus antarcticus TaxID=1507870 RepID=A0A1V8TJX6_9PEZI|nr:hypothetical protein B0A48_03396 [Cryoendolithus antarcticus]
MTLEDDLNLVYTVDYNKLLARYKEGGDKLQACEDRAQELLSDPDLPRFQKTQILVLLAAMTKDGEEAWSLHWEADFLWQVLRDDKAIGHNDKMASRLVELKAGIEETRTALTEKHGKMPREEDILDIFSTDGILREPEAKYLEKERKWFANLRRVGAKSLKETCEDALDESKSKGA